jgi:hypothetical protein
MKEKNFNSNRIPQCRWPHARQSTIKTASANGRFRIFYIYNLIFNMNVKMQNKPKLKSAQIPVIPYKLRTNKNALRPPQPKNKPNHPPSRYFSRTWYTSFAQKSRYSASNSWISSLM